MFIYLWNCPYMPSIKIKKEIFIMNTYICCHPYQTVNNHLNIFDKNVKNLRAQTGQNNMPAPAKNNRLQQ